MDDFTVIRKGAIDKIMALSKRLNREEFDFEEIIDEVLGKGQESLCFHLYFFNYPEEYILDQIKSLEIDIAEFYSIVSQCLYKIDSYPKENNIDSIMMIESFGQFQEF